MANASSFLTPQADLQQGSYLHVNSLDGTLAITVPCFPLYVSGGEVADDARRCSLVCSVMSIEGVDKKPPRCHLCVILYFSFTSYSTCFGQPCAHLQELTTA